MLRVLSERLRVIQRFLFDLRSDRRLLPALDLDQDRVLRADLVSYATISALSGSIAMKQDIAGTTMFDGDQAQKGLALNRMCFSFNSAASRAAFLKDEDGYCRKYGLNEQQRAAIKARNVLELIEAGGNVYYLAKFAGIFGLNVQDIGAQQTGMSVDDFKAKLVAAGR
jgi:protocatechuate 4,5-dioxygenase, alpha chain